DYKVSELAGRDAVFEVVVKDVKRREMPELTSDLVKQLSGCDDIDGWRQKTRERLQQEAEQRAERKFREQVMEKVLAGVRIDLPAQMVEEHIDGMIERLDSRLQHQGLDIAGYLAYRGETMEQLRDSYRSLADKELRRDLVLGAVVKAEKLEVSEQELEQELEVLAKLYRITADKLRKKYEKNGGMDNLRYDLLLRKAEDIIIGSAVKKMGTVA
ncbi:MAG: hypothetical protein N3A57_07255, partial [Negativicutes bacterium]|nr:hypothetical protein [Negativicutes bacterium]